MFEEQLLDRSQTTRIGIHDVLTGATMNVNIDKTRSDDGIAKIHHADCWGNRARSSRAGLDDHMIFNQKYGLFHGLKRCVQTICGEGNHQLKR